MGGHATVYRLTAAFGHRFPGAPPMLLLDHVGARSGTARARSSTPATART